MIIRELQRLRAFVAHRIYLGGAKAGPLAATLRILLRSRGKATATLVDHKAASCEIVDLAQGESSITVSPRGMTNACYESWYPSIKAYRITNVIAESSTSHLAKGNNLIVDDFRLSRQKRISQNGRKVGFYDERIAVASIRHDETIDRGIMLFGDGSFNWYHWLIEILPTAYLARQLPDEWKKYPFLVPEACIQIPSFRDSLLAIINGRSLNFLRAERLYLIKDLIKIDSPVIAPFNLNRDLMPKVSDYAVHGSIIRDYAKALTDGLGIEEQIPNRRIFLYRGEAHRSYNEVEIAKIAELAGFEVVKPQTLSFSSQVKLFASAKIVVGASGAGWANIVFSPHQMRGLSWLPRSYSEFCHYSNLANCLGHDLRFIESDYDVPIRSTVDVHSAPYRLNPIKFSAALDALNSELEK